MTKRNATAGIQFNPTTGTIKPWEVWFQAEGGRKWNVSSCKDEAGAKKSLARLVKRSGCYNLEVR